jgi:glucan phosphoethanolaminetransferase (alkaline phosphatase superfamily)
VKKSLKEVLWGGGAILLVLLWLIARGKNTFDDGWSVGIILMIVICLLHSRPGDTLKRYLKAVVGILLIVSAGAVVGNSFYGGFSSIVVDAVAMYFLWPMMRDIVDR